MDSPLSEVLYKIGIKASDGNPFNPKVDPELKNCDGVINTITGEDYVAKHPVSGREMGIPGQKIVTVFDNKQIYILGSSNDIEGFKRYIEKLTNTDASEQSR